MINLLCSKNCVAPLKIISLPELELWAALLLSQLIKMVLNALIKDINDIFCGRIHRSHYNGLILNQVH